MLDQSVEAVALSLVLFRCQRTVVTQDEAGNCAIFRLNDIAQLVALAVNGTLLIAKIRPGVMDDRDLGGARVDGPVSRRH
jgi:hypothetical protein